MSRLGADARERIQRAVAAAERGTIGEIVPVVLRRSDDYPEARWMLALAFALLATPAAPELLARLAPALEERWIGAALLLVEFAFALLGFALGGFAPVRRLLLGDRRLDEEVSQRAWEAFHALGVSRTRQRSGVLILISRDEHRVRILADQGIHARVPEGYWDETVKRLIGRIREGQLVEGLCETIGAVGSTLAREFPRGDEAPAQELPDHVVVVD